VGRTTRHTADWKAANDTPPRTSVAEDPALRNWQRQRNADCCVAPAKFWLTRLIERRHGATTRCLEAGQH
jgi:hypothetical protein